MERPEPLQLHEMHKKNFAKLNFPKFVPEVDILDDRSWLWKEGIKLPMIFVLLWQLLDERNKETLSKASSKGLHDYLGYDGKITLSTIMPDEMLERLSKEDYFRLIDNLRPDATMIADNFAYTDAPLYQSWTQAIKLVNYAGDFLDLDIPLVGLIKGANGLQIRWIVERQLEMGYVSFAIPARELLNEGMLSDFLYCTFRAFGDNHDAELLVYGVSRKVGHENLDYSTLSWFISARQNQYFKNGIPYDLSDPNVRFEECDCDACKGIMPQELLDLSFYDEMTYTRALARHNLLDLNNSLAGR